MRPFEQNLKRGPALIYINTPTRDHLPIFADTALAEQAILQLARSARDLSADIIGYCLLPANLHAIVGFKEDYDIGNFVYHYKWLVSRAIICLEHGEFHERLYRKGKFKPWMNRFEQADISSQEQFDLRLAYIHNSPVEKGLAAVPSEWKYSSAHAWQSGKNGTIEISRDLAPFLRY